MSDQELPPEMEEAIRNAMANGMMDAIDEALAKAVLVVGMQVANTLTAEWKPDAPYTREEMLAQCTELFFKTLGMYRDNWITRVLMVLRGEINDMFSERLNALHEEEGDDD